MDRKTAIQSAYKSLGKEATFYDGMITCSTLVGKAICKVVWNMSQADNNRFIEATVAGIPEQFCGEVLEVPVGTGVLYLPEVRIIRWLSGLECFLRIGFGKNHFRWLFLVYNDFFVFCAIIYKLVC